MLELPRTFFEPSDDREEVAKNFYVSDETLAREVP